VIDQKTAFACAALIALMLVAAVWRTAMLDDWATLAIQNEGPLSSLLLFAFPASSALVVGALYWESRRARADDAKVQPWRKWGKSLSISYCGGLLLLQGVLILQSLGLDLSAIGRAGGILLAIMCLLAINQMPKLPWIERKFAPGGDLGPIYGPRYMRTQSRITVLFMIAVIAYSLAAPATMGWRLAPYILLATALLIVWSIVCRLHLGRKWKLEQLAAPARSHEGFSGCVDVSWFMLWQHVSKRRSPNA
jgi:hypothetical protein